MNIASLLGGTLAMAFFAFCADRVSRRIDGASVVRSVPFIVAIAIGGVTLFGIAITGTRAAAVTVLVAAVAVCSATDVMTGYVFDAVTLPALGLILACDLAGQAIAQGLIGAVACAAVPLFLYAITRGRGIGLGDFKLAACIGAALGLRNGLMTLGMAFIAGGAIATVLLLSRRATFGAEIRFAPFLAASSALMAFVR